MFLNTKQKIDRRDLKCIGEMESLPNDILQIIFRFLKGNEFTTFQLVCKGFQQLVKKLPPVFWKMKMTLEFGEGYMKFIGNTPLSSRLYLIQTRRFGIAERFNCVDEDAHLYFYFDENECGINTYKGEITYNKVANMTKIMSDGFGPRSFGETSATMVEYIADGDAFELYPYATGAGNNILLRPSYLKKCIKKLDKQCKIRSTDGSMHW